MNINIIKVIKQQKLGRILEDVKLANYTSYRVGGCAKLFVYPNNIEKLIILIKLLQEYKVKYKVIGNGSNVIFSDQDYNGVIIKLDQFNSLKRDDNMITVGAGYNLKKLAYKMSKLGLSGLEFATGIPGSVGGAVYMNAGAYKTEMGTIISKVKVLTPNLEIKELTNKELDFSYRSSFFQKNPGYICLEATMVLEPGLKTKIMALVCERKQKRLLTQPLEYPNAGSVFRNPSNDYAGRLIEDCNLKGYQIGGALVSPKHANFIINIDNATALDVKTLIYEVKAKVKTETGVDLLIEQEFVNWE